MGYSEVDKSGDMVMMTIQMIKVVIMLVTAAVDDDDWE